MPTVHLLNPLANACGGSEWHTLSLFEMLAEFGPVEIWTPYTPDKSLFGRFPIRQVDTGRGVFPRGGTLVFVGTYFESPPWIPLGRFDRLVVIYNIEEPSHLQYTISRLKQLGVPKVEVITVSRALAKDLAGFDAVHVGTQHSWIDTNRFAPPSLPLSRPFTIGRLSRDVPEKFHEDDPELFTSLANDGVRIRIMGGMCLRLEEHPNIELLPEGTQPPEQFLHSLDAMIFRTTWFEAFGRVIAEGMASGVVPVAHERGGYSEIIRHGVDGALFKTNEEAREWILRLRDDPELRQKIAAEARANMEDLFGPAARQRLADFYFKGFPLER